MITPTLPGGDGTPRPGRLARPGDLAGALLALLAALELRDVLVVGSSIGGWIAAEMALRDGEGRVGRIALIDAVGIDVPGEPITDFFALDPAGIAAASFHDPAKFAAGPPPDPANVATLRQVAGDPYMHDPTLLGRLGAAERAALVLWGESDGIAGPGYGRTYAEALGAPFALIERAGHLPQLEQPSATFAALDAFAPAAA